MSAHLTEEEQIEAFKRWWQRYGTATALSVVLACAFYLGWNLYQQHIADSATQASQQYEKLADLIKIQDKPLSAEQKGQVKSLSEGLQAEYKGSLYADLAALAQAKIAAEDKDFASAAASLRRVMETSSDAPTASLARLRLAKVLAADGKIDEAIGLLGTSGGAEFEASYAETKGDIMLGEKRLAEAFSAYQAALTATSKMNSQESFVRRNVLEIKLEHAREPGSSKNPLADTPVNPHSAAPATAAPAAEAK